MIIETSLWLVPSCAGGLAKVDDIPFSRSSAFDALAWIRKQSL